MSSSLLSNTSSTRPSASPTSSNSSDTTNNNSSSSPHWFPSDDSAIRVAREEVKSLFRTSDQLLRIQPYLSECTRKKLAISTQLSSSIRTQVDETRLGLQL